MTTTLPTPRHTARLSEAEDLGRDAGRQFTRVASETCSPDQWTPERRRQWTALLEALHINPWVEGPYPDDATPQQAEQYAKRWEQGFVLGSHEQQAIQRRTTGKAA